MNTRRFESLTSRYTQLRVALVGDFCLDRYIEIDPMLSERSIETGLEVFNVARVRAQPGGCGTILNNLSALGAGIVFPVGFAGDDGEGYELVRALNQVDCVDMSHFFQSPDRRTFSYTKPLLIEKGGTPRELNRVDFKNWSSTPKQVEDRLVDSVCALAKQVDAFVLLEQVDEENTGVLTGAVIEEIDRICREQPELLVLADSRRGAERFPAVGLKINREEFARLSGNTANAPFKHLCGAVSRLAMERGQPMFVSLSDGGIVGAEPGLEAEHVPCLPVQGEIDVVGAGDAVMANLTLALAAGAKLNEAMRIAMAAASIVIHQLGTTGVAKPEGIRSLVCAH